MANIPIFAHPARRLRQIQLTLLATPPALFLVFHCDPRHILVVTGCQDWFRLTIHFGVFLLKTTPADSGIFQRVVRHCGCLVPKAYPAARSAPWYASFCKLGFPSYGTSKDANNRFENAVT